MQVVDLMSFVSRAEVLGEGEKQKTRVRGWIGVGRNRQIYEKEKLEEYVCITSLHSKNTE